MKVVLECIKAHTDVSMGDHAIIIATKVAKKVKKIHLFFEYFKATIFKNLNNSIQG